MTDQQKTLTVHIHSERDGSFWAEVDELPGCFASGWTMDELRESLEEAIGLYLSTSDRRAEVKLVDSPREVETVKEQKVLVS